MQTREFLKRVMKIARQSEYWDGRAIADTLLRWLYNDGEPLLEIDYEMILAYLPAFLAQWGNEAYSGASNDVREMERMHREFLSSGKLPVL